MKIEVSPRSFPGQILSHGTYEVNTTTQVSQNVPTAIAEHVVIRACDIVLRIKEALRKEFLGRVFIVGFICDGAVCALA